MTFIWGTTREVTQMKDRKNGGLVYGSGFIIKIGTSVKERIVDQ